MRIRKRQVPFPLSSLSPVPISDPYLCRPIINGVQLQLYEGHPHQDPSQQVDKASCFDPEIGRRGCSDGPVPHYNHEMEKRAQTKDCVVAMKKDCRCEDGETGADNDICKGGSLGAKLIGKMVHQESRTSHEGVGGWYEGERMFPLKKRRGSNERKSVNEALIEKDKLKTKTEMKKKYVQKIGNYGEENVDKDTYKQNFDCNISTGRVSSARKRSRGIDAILIEGSRCSRVNGRGWRCRQQTLVGYSLCEHHLGKGRLRSLTSIRSRSALNKADESLSLSRPLLP